MEKLYRILVAAALTTISLAICAFILPLLGIAVGVVSEQILHAPEWLYITLCILAGRNTVGGIFLGGYFLLIQNDLPSERNETSRLQSCTLWLCSAFLTAFLSLVAAWYWESDLFLFGFCAIPASLTAGLVFPFRKHAKGDFSGILGFGAAFLIFFVGGLILGRTPRDISYAGDHPEKIPFLSDYQKKQFFPPHAKDIRLTGTTMACDWTCTVSERDFDEYRKRDRAPAFLKNAAVPGSEKWSKPYYFYNRRRGDGGGLTLRYSVPEQKFYGYYSHH